MSESKSLLIFQYLDEAIDFINQFISANKEYFDKFNPNVLTKLINIESDLVFFVNKFNQKDKDYLSHHGIYIPLLTRSINLGGFYDILANDEVDIANKVDTLKEYIGELSGILQEANQFIKILMKEIRQLFNLCLMNSKGKFRVLTRPCKHYTLRKLMQFI